MAFAVAHAMDEKREYLDTLFRLHASLCEAGAIEFRFLQGNEKYLFEWTADTQQQLLQMEARLAPVRSRLLAGTRCLRWWGIHQGKALVKAFRD